MLYVPCHLPNKLEYKVLSCISVHYQSRMTSNEIASTPRHPLTVQAGQAGIVLCVSKIYTLCIRMGGGGCEQMCTLHAVVVLWVCLRETWTVVETILNTS